MNKVLLFCLIVILLGFLGCSDKSTEPNTEPQNTNSIRLTDFPGGAREGAVSFSYGDSTAYIGLGTNGLTALSDFYKFNHQDSTWSLVTVFPGGGRERAVSFVIGDKAYIGLGMANGVIKNDLWQYNIIDNTWAQKADFPDTARVFPVAMAINDKGYVGMGCASNTLSSAMFRSFWEYNPVSDTWIQKADFPGAGRKGATAFSLNNKGYYGFGFENQYNPADSTFSYVFYNDLWSYNPDNNQWVAKASCPGEKRWCPIATTLNNSGYIGLGWNASKGFLKDIWKYDPATDIWVQQPDFNGSGRSRAASFTLGNSIYIGTGWGENTTLSDIWKYTP